MSVYSRYIGFKVPVELAEALRMAARREGIGFSEWIRQAVEEKLGRSEMAGREVSAQ